MYTRIKNQKSGLKLLTNASTRAARLPLSSAASSLASSCASSATHSGTASAGDSPSSTSLSSSGCAATHMKHGFMNNASVSSSDSSATVCLDQSSSLNRLLSNMGMAIGEDVSPPPSSPFSTQPTTRIPFSENQSSNIVNNSSSSSSKNATTTATKTQPQNKYTRSKKLNSASDEVNGFEEIGDINCILYVKSTWEKYAREIDTEKGPSRLVIDENSQCPHLNGFVAFDLEHWWAERALDSIGEHSFSTTKSSNNPSSSSSKSINGNNNTTAFNANIASFNPSKPKSTISPLTGLNSFTIGFS